MPISPRSQTPVTFTAAGNAVASAPPSSIPTEPLDVDLIVTNIPPGPITVGQPFDVNFRLGISSILREGCRKIVSIAIQHVQTVSPPPTAAPNASTAAFPFAPAPVDGITSPRLGHANLGSIASNPLSRTPSQGPSFDDKMLVKSPQQQQLGGEIRLLRPIPVSGDEERYAKVDDVRFIGSSVQILQPIALTSPAHSQVADDSSDDETLASVEAHVKSSRIEGYADFDLTWLPLRPGLLSVGGIRASLIDSRMEDIQGEKTSELDGLSPRTLKEWDIIGEVWAVS